MFLGGKYCWRGLRATNSDSKMDVNFSTPAAAASHTHSFSTVSGAELWLLPDSMVHV